jgi:NAD(P)-dependent dehydrogenase (short-subunit alcohol dehydrogenase family)
MRLQDKNAIVTAAGSGIGRAIALGFAREGARVVAGDIDLASAQKTVETIELAGGEAFAIEVDVAKKEQVDAMFQAAIESLGRIHIVVSGPGISTTRNFLDVPEDEWDRVLDVSLKGMYLTGQAAARHMANEGGGSIVNISSICDEVAQANYPHYVAAKGGVKMLTKAMALDLVEHGIRVNAIAPGLTQTGTGFMHKEEFADVREQVLARIPMSRPAQPDEMVGAAIFLASEDESSYVTGVSLPVDGGYLAY